VTVGSLAGYFGGWVDLALSRLTELFQVLPALLFAMVLVSLFQPSLGVVAVAIGTVSWTGTAPACPGRIHAPARSGMTSTPRGPWAPGTGARCWWRSCPTPCRHWWSSATLIIGVAILFEAGLSFLGLSDPNVMSWGLMIGSNRRNILECWWAVSFPGAAIFADGAVGQPGRRWAQRCPQPQTAPALGP
jgi:peptide/nickel transport system permease protein